MTEGAALVYRVNERIKVEVPAVAWVRRLRGGGVKVIEETAEIVLGRGGLFFGRFLRSHKVLDGKFHFRIAAERRRFLGLFQGYFRFKEVLDRGFIGRFLFERLYGLIKRDFARLGFGFLTGRFRALK
ncbi:MAG TPA: hypothetical protein PK542_05550 [Treponemataceae bacterium]|nr:hypothetical protein [Treponemataceae bacterium]